MIGVALEVAEDRCAEDRGDDDDAEEAELNVDGGDCPRAVEEDFAVADGAEVFGGDVEERHAEEKEEIGVSGDAFQPELEFEEEKFPEHFAHSSLVLRLIGEAEEVDVFEIGVVLGEAVAGVFSR